MIHEVYIYFAVGILSMLWLLVEGVVARTAVLENHRHKKETSVITSAMMDLAFFLFTIIILSAAWKFNNDIAAGKIAKVKVSCVFITVVCLFINLGPMRWVKLMMQQRNHDQKNSSSA